MPRYTFKLRDDDSGVEDENGVALPDAEIAYRYACDVVRELMNGRELSTRSWQLEVYEDGQERVFEIPFVRLDRTLDHLNAQMRDAVEQGKFGPSKTLTRLPELRSARQSHWWLVRAASPTSPPTEGGK